MQALLLIPLLLSGFTQLFSQVWSLDQQHQHYLETCVRNTDFYTPLLGVCMLSCFSPVQLYANLWTIACQAPLSMGFSKQEYWIGLRFPPRRIFLIQGWNPSLLCLLHWQAGSLPLHHLGSPIPDLLTQKLPGGARKSCVLTK